jgi:hypothetical protein
MNRGNRRFEIDLAAPIEPGKSAAGIALGKLAEALPRPLKKESLPSLERFDYSALSVWIREGLVHQVCVREGYSGILPEGIGIGSSIADVERLIGQVEEDMDDNLVVIGYPGWCFSTEEWCGHKSEENPGARITWICIYEVKANEA